MKTEQDILLLSQKNISEHALQSQLDRFVTGFPFIDIVATASVDKGIMRVSDADIEKYLEVWKDYLSKGKSVGKFVPASGAASRMFKNLYEFLDGDKNEPTNDFEKKFFVNLSKFAFYSDLDQVCKQNIGKDIIQLLAGKSYKVIVDNLLNEKGLNYGSLPKGLLQFHKYADGSCTPVEEQLREAAWYACNEDKSVNVHFTVSPEHLALFKKLVGDKRLALESKYGVSYEIGFSEQKPCTDTIAVDMDNQPIRDAKGNLVFRPGGHGALIENLNDLDSDVVFVKNIDNVSPDKNLQNESKYKELLAGILASVQAQVFKYLSIIDSTKYTHDDLVEMLQFLQHTLHVRHVEVKLLEDAELVLYIKRKLDRPCRVCGMVKNIGEPGGGPFLVLGDDDTISPQILESSQIDMTNASYRDMFEKGTHFNPVDLVCGLKDYRGNAFNLKDFVDENTGFISYKSKDGKELKALELPGLWNGAMADWNTVFVEVPISTFNPVKTVNDLLRDEHLC